MKLHLSFLSLVTALVLTACSGTDKGNQAATNLKAAWGNPDAIKQVAATYVAQRDSLTMPGDASSMDKAFVDACADNDTIHMVALAITTTPEDLGKQVGNDIINQLKQSRAIEQSNNQLQLVGLALSMLGRNDDVTKVYTIIDQAASSLSEEDQMKVYINSTTPDALGDALRQDRATDAATADRQAAIIESLLTGDDLEAFKQHYNAK